MLTSKLRSLYIEKYNSLLYMFFHLVGQLTIVIHIIQGIWLFEFYTATNF